MCSVMRLVLVFVLLAALPGSSVGAEPQSDEEKTIYAIGLIIAQSLDPYSFTEKEVELVKAGLADGVLKRPPKVDASEYRVKVQALARERAQATAELEKKDSAEFLEKAAAERGAVKTESGLIYREIKAGTGEKPKATDTVKVNYHGTLRDGTVFDSSVERGTPATFPLNRVVKCWTEGLQMMKVGGKSKLVCPSSIAYGDRGSPPKIKPGAALAFEVELLSIEEPAKLPPGHP